MVDTLTCHFLHQSVLHEMISGFGVQVLELQECGVQLEQCQLVRYSEHKGTPGKLFDEPKVSAGCGVCMCLCVCVHYFALQFLSLEVSVCVIPILRIYQLHDISEAL